VRARCGSEGPVQAVNMVKGEGSDSALPAEIVGCMSSREVGKLKIEERFTAAEPQITEVGGKNVKGKASDCWLPQRRVREGVLQNPWRDRRRRSRVKAEGADREERAVKSTSAERSNGKVKVEVGAEVGGTGLLMLSTWELFRNPKA